MLATTTEILHVLAISGPWLILPLSIAEGPIVTILAGLLAASGHLDWRVALGMVVLGDLIGDLLFYAMGRGSLGVWTGTRLGRWFGLSPEKTAALSGQMNNHATRLLLVGKWTHALGAVVLVAAGCARVPVARFLLVNLIGTIPKSAAFFLLGFFAGQHLHLLSGGLAYAPLLLVPLGAALIFIMLRCNRAPAG